MPPFSAIRPKFRPTPAAAPSPGAAPAFKWANGSDNTNANGSLTTFNAGATNPAGSNGSIAAGDLMLLFVLITVASGTVGTVTTPSGWTAVGSTNQEVVGGFTGHYAAFYKISSGSETFSYPVSWTNPSYGASWAIAVYSGANGAAPIDASLPLDNNTYAASIICPEIFPSSAPDRLVCAFLEPGGQGTYTAPGSMVSRFNVGSTSSDRPEILIADEALSVTGGTGQRVASCPTVQSAGISIALKS